MKKICMRDGCRNEWEVTPYNKARKYCTVICAGLDRRGKRRDIVAGKRSPFYKHGRYCGQTHLFYEAKRKAFERDDYRCMLCSRQDIGNLSLTVLRKDCDKHNNSIDNLLTVCRGCFNKRLHFAVTPEGRALLTKELVEAVSSKKIFLG